MGTTAAGEAVTLGIFTDIQYADKPGKAIAFMVRSHDMCASRDANN